MHQEIFKQIVEKLLQKGDDFKEELKENLEGGIVELEKEENVEDANILLTIFDEDFPLVEIEIDVFVENDIPKLEAFIISNFEEESEEVVGQDEKSRVFDLNWENAIKSLEEKWGEILDWVFDNLEETLS